MIDRSVHTLLAHCSSLQRMTGVPYGDLAASVLGDAGDVLWPHHVIYLDVPDAVIQARNSGKFTNDSIFMNPEFNFGIRLYFQKLARIEAPKVTWMDATLSVDELRGFAVASIRALLQD